MKYNLLAFDLDGTLTNSQKIITPRTKTAIYAARKEGATIALASGRPVYGIMPLATELEFDRLGGYILAYNGGCIIDCKTKEIIYDKKIPDHLTKEICRFAMDRNYGILTYEGDCVITNQKANQYVQAEAQINHLPIRQINNLDEYIDFPVNKFLITEDPEIVQMEIPNVQSAFPELNVFTSAPFFMEIVPPGIDKADTLAFLLDRLGMNRKELACFGDGGNDVNMLRYAGLGIAMANANDACKEAADHITLNNDEDGCGVAIEKMLRGEL
ncbi:MAG: Cof-type HAD-IIB family hydrolase [Lachnospiraceae bacterium]